MEKKNDLNYIQNFMNDVHLWADNTFGKNRTAIPALHHLSKEVKEVISGIENDHTNDSIEMEFADCFILIINAASKYGMTFESLIKRAESKMIINKKRLWNPPDENGVCQHIEKNENY